jgi:hypothetical protein
MIGSEFGAAVARIRRGRAGRNKMKRFDASLAAAVALGGFVLAAPAGAAPPTVTPSPGYDARLQEQRTAAPVIYQPVAPAPVPVHRRHLKRSNDGAH